ncbi:hypothetical protein KAFR_0L00110 [Kazachstania africana CBS 2517]|uniref:Sir1 ORC-binding domain-containing protein n=1 Tax=Kazachstania africana (strain ATCC 22294 / BCRC 22015 / CBS 2517 / CECT 1963 / NBRC 1671 / NRRL Y-8276) TaxID=1071382 RepID=H2B1W9_KAZAF|nr:hypothetical protein KAFR_0L00110 [Kazachstania africana CBS 2517]CCF60619.1 hypothetical protein KAFR_0L00110 [Kazachstania africana CBS 2517]
MATSVYITNNIAIIDGWIVDTSKNFVLTMYNCKQQLDSYVFTKLNQHVLQNYKSLANPKNQIFAVESEMLFQHAKLEAHRFYKLRDHSVTLRKSRRAERTKKIVEQTIDVKCHRLALGRRNYIYLAPKSELNDAGAIEMMSGITTVRKEKDNSIFVKLLKLEDFHFIQGDFNFICSTYHDINYRVFEGQFLEPVHTIGDRTLSNYYGAD